MTPTAPPRLSPRQLEVLELILAGKTCKDVANTLAIATATVGAHVTAIHRIYGVKRNCELFAACDRQPIVKVRQRGKLAHEMQKLELRIEALEARFPV